MSDKKPMSKTEILSAMASRTGLTKQQVDGFFEELLGLTSENLSDSGPGVVNLPGLLKITVQRKPATPERKGINPFTKEETIFKAKPASNVVKIRPLKRLKDAV